MIRTREAPTVALALLLAVVLLTSCPAAKPPDGDGDDDPNGTPAAFTLTVQMVGGGSIESDPHAIDCPGVCEVTLDEGASLSLIATPHEGNTFDGWAGDHDCRDGVVTLTSDTNCSAVFHDAGMPSHRLEVGLLGEGSVTSAPAGIDCPTTSCIAVMNEGTLVTLTPTHATGYTFDSWHGDPDCADGQVTMTTAVTCVAAFEPVGAPSHVLDVSLTVGGSVTSTPTGIDCPSSDCYAVFQEGTTVELTGTPDPDYAFSHWGGDSDCSDGSLSMTGDRACSAAFTPTVVTYDLTVTKEGNGTVISSPAGIQCGSACQTSFTDGTTVTLTPTPDGGHEFAGWGGDGDCGDGHVTMTSDRACTATFQPPYGFTAISGGGTHSLALDQSGDVWAWGSNAYGELGDGTTQNALVPTLVDVPEGVTFTAIAAADWHSLALDQSGDVWAWGYNCAGQLGDGTTQNALVPTRVDVPDGVIFTAIAAEGHHSLASDTSGDVWAWGSNQHGQLGDGTGQDSSVPTQVDVPDGVIFTAITAAASHSVALDQSGDVWAWGRNDYGELGDGTGQDSSVPTQVDVPDGVIFTAIAADGNHTLALDRGGDVWAWGRNQHGQLGDGTTQNALVPTEADVPDGVAFNAIAAAHEHSLAIDTNGDAWAWGSNQHGQLGDGTGQDSLVPTEVDAPDGVSFIVIATAARSSLAIDETGDAWAWGSNAVGQLGDGTTQNGLVPKAVQMP